MVMCGVDAASLRLRAQRFEKDAGIGINRQVDLQCRLVELCWLQVDFILQIKEANHGTSSIGNRRYGWLG